MKNNYDNLLQHQKDKDVLGSEFSDLKDTLSVTEEMLKEATTRARAEKAESKHADCVENTNKQTKAAVIEASTMSCELNIQKGSGKVDHLQL